MFDLVATGTARGHGSANLIGPALKASDRGVAWIILPGATLVASGSATIVVGTPGPGGTEYAKYEAYAVNLNHKPSPRSEPVDEVTRYTNYPFDKIVRYKNSYFGVAADALYLLEGTTDYAAAPTAIPYEAKTCITDFESVQNKTANSVYFAGRLGHDVAVTLYVGEVGPQAYAYSSPRGPNAQNFRQPLGRGIKARYFALGIAGSGELSLDSIEFDVIQLNRKV
jgi:hypothetical protein